MRKLILPAILLVVILLAATALLVFGQFGRTPAIAAGRAPATATPAAPAAITPPPQPPKPVNLNASPIAHQVRTVPAIPVTRCGNNSPRVLLSFDDWGTPSHILAIARIMLRYHAGAIFFPIAKQANQSPWVVKWLRAHGFWVGNHTYDHPQFPGLSGLSSAKVRSEIVNGVHSTYLRPPGGNYNARTRTIAASLGYHLCLWTVDTNDWRGLPATTLAQTAVHGSHWSPPAYRGGVVLMHMLPGSHALEALPRIISGLHSRGLQLCHLPQKPTTVSVPYPLPC